MANADFYGGSLINQVQNNANLFMIFKARESAKTGSRKSVESKRSSKEGRGSGRNSALAYEGLPSIQEGSSPSQEGRRAPGMLTRSLKTIEEEAPECTENRDPSTRNSGQTATARAPDDAKAGKHGEILPK